MSQQIAIVQALSGAWATKDGAVFRQHLQEDYYFKGPMMEIKSAEECIGLMVDCPFESHCANSELIEQGNRVVHIFNWEVTAPFTATIPSVEVFEFVENKVKQSRLFFDTALFPAEFAEAM